MATRPELTGPARVVWRFAPDWGVSDDANIVTISQI